MVRELHRYKMHSNKWNGNSKISTAPKILSAPNNILSGWQLELFYYFFLNFCPISGWFGVLLVQKANWNSSCSSIKVSCLIFSCYDCMSSPANTIKPFEGASSWKLLACRKDHSFYPHHCFIYVLVSFSLSSQFKRLKKTDLFFFFKHYPSRVRRS